MIVRKMESHKELHQVVASFCQLFAHQTTHEGLETRTCPLPIRALTWFCPLPQCAPVPCIPKNVEEEAENKVAMEESLDKDPAT